VFSKPGPFRNGVKDSDAWRKIASATVFGNDNDEAISIPEEDFHAVHMEPESTQAFFVTLTRPMLASFSNEDYEEKEGDVQASLWGLDFLVGAGVGQYPFKFDMSFSYNLLSEGTVFAGTVLYTVFTEESPSSQPTVVPTIKPTMDLFDYVGHKELVTNPDGNINFSSYGNFFDLVVVRDLVIKSISIHIDLQSLVDSFVKVKVFTKQSGFRDPESSVFGQVWRLIADTAVEVTGDGVNMRIPDSSFTPLKLYPNMKQGFLVILESPNIIYTVSKASEGSLYTSNNDLKILVGAGVGVYSFDYSNAAAYDDLYPERLFNGIIHYSVFGTPSPSWAPTNTPSMLPSLTPSHVPSNAPSATAAPSYSPTATVVFGPSKKLVTTYKGGNASFGAMFVVKAGIEAIKILTIDFHTTATNSLNVQIWTRLGGYLGYETKPLAWRKVASVQVQGQGQNSPTRVPEEDFSSVNVWPRSSQAFYISLDEPTLQYTNGDKLLEDMNMFTNPYFQFEVGVGMGDTTPFGNVIYPDRCFNGDLWYKVAQGTKLIPSKQPTASLTLTPVSMAPLSEPSNVSTIDVTDVSDDRNEPINSIRFDKNLSTTFDSHSSNFGCMFNLQASRTISLKTISFHTDLTDSLPNGSENVFPIVEVYTKSGSYLGYESNTTAWTRIAFDNNVRGRGLGQGTLIPEPNFTPVTISMGTIQALYVTLNVNHLQYSDLDGENDETIFSNEDIRIFGGVGIGGYPFGTADGQLVFNGIFHYSVLSNNAESDDEMGDITTGPISTPTSADTTQINLDNDETQPDTNPPDLTVNNGMNKAIPVAIVFTSLALCATGCFIWLRKKKRRKKKAGENKEGVNNRTYSREAPAEPRYPEMDYQPMSVSRIVVKGVPTQVEDVPSRGSSNIHSRHSFDLQA